MDSHAQSSHSHHSQHSQQSQHHSKKANPSHQQDRPQGAMPQEQVPLVHQQAPRDAQQRRREFLWRERVKLEMQVQAVLAQVFTLQQEGQQLARRKAALQQRRPELAAQILLSSLVGLRSLPAERQEQYERERVAQEEQRVQQALLHCQGDLTAIQSHIEVLDLERSLLS